MTIESHPAGVMSYARARLFLGASAVGTMSVVAALSLVLDLPGLLPAAPVALTSEVAWLVLVVALGAALLAPFDLFGGWLLPREYGRSQEPLRAFVLRYAQGVLVHGTALVSSALFLMGAARLGGATLTLMAYALVSVVLLAAQPSIAAAVGRTRLRPARGAERAADLGQRTLVLESGHPHVTGGAYGLPGRAGWVVPRHWLDRNDRVALALQVRRRAWITASGARDRGVMLALTWNLVPIVLVVAGFGAPDTVAAVTRLALVSTLWSFVGVLVLPSPSRWAVYQADAAAVAGGVDRAAFHDGLVALERDQDDELERSRGVETIFHPVPAARHRAAALRGDRATGPRALAAWHAARTALYLSWAGIGLLGRAVHCNLGRPEAWVFLPSD
jgi:type II secretory pathway pseudopilin PulG